MRTSEDPHRDAASYALGVLDPGDAYRFEDHLMVCPGCSFVVSGFGGVRTRLDAYVRSAPPGVPPVVSPGGAVLRGALGAVEARRRAGRRRRLALVTALAALAVGGPLGVLAVGAEPRHAAVRWSGSDGVTGASAVATATSRAWGSEIGFELMGREAAGACELVAVGRDGSRETVTTWYGTGTAARPVVTAGGAALHPDQIDHFEVRAPDGRALVTLAE
ncbi:zf-HC2 domain-containing protein [Streptomyces sp. NBC_01497]|uniref:zf-HC2 domain-containing protein n=1 Tax=Streptomyces sp. NBC_01497 TaxID=2903885 RepID=UPI002E349486|nr:zf-HC2 domain-containing protein [Streptomyces sp. NBC_01497]